jgi:uncharacterized protein (TIGR02677 family)
VSRTDQDRVSVVPLARRLLGRVDAFRYATAPNAPTYRAVLQVCADAMQRYVIELRPDEILRALREGGYVVEVDDVEALETNVLDQLVSWGNLAATADPAGVERLSDFYRRRLVYHLTDVGEAAHRAVTEVEATVGRAGSLQANMLVKIRDGLAALADAAPRRDPDELLRVLHDVNAAFETLTHEANRFMTDLGGMVAGGDDEDRGEDDARFIAYKQAVLAYISRFVEQLRRLAEEITANLAAVEAADVDALITVAATSADLPDFDGDGSARHRWASEQRTRWQGVARWFTGDGVGEPTVERLAGFAVGAVLTLTRTLGRLNDRRGRAVDRTTDFVTLARWFTECDDDKAAHVLWRTAFGLHGARHTHLAEEDPERTATRTSWWDAEPVVVPTRLRTHGRAASGGRHPRAADFSSQRRWLAAKARREREQLEAAVARFADQPLRLSQLAELDAGELDLLLGLLDAALASPRDAEGARSTRTTDGRLHVRLSPPADGATCRLTTPDGALQAPDYRIHVTDAAGVPVGSRSASA